MRHALAACDRCYWCLRSEYGYTWSDILQRQNDGDIQEVSLLFNLGVRF